MKRKTNNFGWPYIAVVVKNELNKPTVVCEAVIMGEKYHAYRFVIQSLLKMAPRRPKE